MNPDLYHEATQNTALVDLSRRCWIDVKGTDARKFLNGILTNNIQGLVGKSGCYAALCTPKGKMIADLFCYTCEDYFGIDCDAPSKEAVLADLKKYIVFQKVGLKDRSGHWGACAVVGPKAKDGLAARFRKLPEKEFEYDFAEWEGFKIWVIFKKMWGLDTFELWTARGELAALKKRLALPEIDTTTGEILRIESATPLWGIDMDENTIPQEASLYKALSFNKGCYVGQEIVARLEHRGHVGKQLRLLQPEGKEIPQKGEKIFSPEGEEVGRVTSACFSPKHDAPLALGYIRYASLNLPRVVIASGRFAKIIQHNLLLKTP